ncbi:hypothetical protein yc1106_05212 [Curvularia clavata]|uniref:Uncharacterized protein n=1 Tax=Curvularia clavata TaxID=95742 RepID=A0A9Q8ZBW3_CURCL|nr:hypothetical protein yc1106_05212 [Curvularia clavata]
MREKDYRDSSIPASHVPTQPPPTRTSSRRNDNVAPSRSSGQNDRPQRPGLERRRTTARTRYIDMLLGLDSVSPVHNLLSSAFVWLLLAGYIVFPATFTKLQRTESKSPNNGFSAAALHTVRNIPLLYVAAFACGIGVAGCLWLWWQHRKNYVWVIHRIFLPALLNSIAGLISTIINVYSAQDGQYSVTARVTIIVTAACSVVAAALFLLYNTIMLRLVRRRHEREVKAVEKEQSSRDDGRGDLA